MHHLTERRAADRKQMAQAIKALVSEHHASIEEEITTSKAIVLSIRGAGGLCLTLDLDGASPQPDTFVLSWFISHDSDARLEPDAFAPGGTVNPVHYRKATQVVHGFDALKETLGQVLYLAASGYAFQSGESQQQTPRNAPRNG